VSGIYHDNPYAALLETIWYEGRTKEDRTGVGTRAMFGTRMEFDLRYHFPLLTGKKIHWKSVVEELLWFMRGETHTSTLNATIWDEWADENGDCGPIYGYQWRNWGASEKLRPKYNYPNTEYEALPVPGIDQLQNVVDSLRNNPDSRRHIVSAWNVEDVDQMALPPCHLLFQFYVEDGHLDCQMYQRSCDMFLGVPFNIASYALLTHIVAHMTGLKPGRFIWIGGDTHVYLNHEAQVMEYLSRTGKPSPKLKLRPGRIQKTLDNWEFDNFELLDYDPHPAIKAPVAV
jgi:thymidylate synthase